MCLYIIHHTLHTITRLDPFTHSWFYNATAVRGALWWLHQSHSIYYANHQHSPFARRCKLHFPSYRLIKVSWKSVQPFPRTVVSYFWQTEKKQKTKTEKNICKTYILPPHRRLRKLTLTSICRRMISSRTNRNSWWLAGLNGPLQVSTFCV